MSIVSEVLFSDWFIYNVKEHSSPKDMWNLVQTSKYFNKYIDKNIINECIIINIQKRLRNVLGIKYDAFIKYITKYNIIISGSFIIQCILNEHYGGSDIDLYSYNEMTSETFFDIVNIKELDKEQYERFDTYGDLPNIEDIINVYLKNGHKLQNIRMHEIENYEDAKKYVLNDFDLNICKNLFSIMDGKPNIYVHNLNNICNKKDVLQKYTKSYKVDPGTLKRINKYQSRGFEIKILETFNKIDHIYYEGKLYPFIVYKNNQNGYFSKLTMFNFVMNENKLIANWNLHGGKVALCNTEPYEAMMNGNSFYVAYMDKILDALHEGKVDTLKNINESEIPTPSNPLSNILNIPHIPVTCKVGKTGISRKPINQNFLLINFNDLDDKRKVIYENIFKTEKTPKNFLIGNDIRHFN